MTGCRFPRGRIRHSRFRRNAGFWFVVFIRLFGNYSAVLRLCAAGISKDSLYLAMVRRETSMPRKASRLASASSEYGVGVDEAKPAAGKGLSEAMRSSAASSVPLSVWGRCFFIRARVWLRLPSMLSRAFDDMQGGGFGSTFAQSFYLQYQRFVQIGGGHACRVEFFQCGQRVLQHCFIQHPL